MAIRIITDSASDILSNEHPNITVLPMTITFGQEQYLDGVSISHHGFYEKLTSTDALPTTSQISPYEFEEALKNVQQAGDTAVVITMSSKLSGTYQSAVIAAQSFPDTAFVVDSENVCVGQRILVEYAQRLIEAGQGAAQIAAALDHVKHHIRVVALLDTLEFLRRGGRISKTTGFVGGILSIKPVVAVEHGEVAFLGKARGSKNGSNLLTQQIVQANGIDFSMPYAVGYTGLDSSLLEAYIQDSKSIWQEHTPSLQWRTIGATIGTHVGPGAIAVAFFQNAE